MHKFDFEFNPYLLVVIASKLVNEIRAKPEITSIIATVVLVLVSTPNVKETLKKIHEKGVSITVASSKGKDALNKLLKHLEISEYISLIFGEQDVVNKKPAPDMALLVLKKTNSKAEETLVVGDTIFDIDMGKAAGCKTCGVTYGNNTIEQLEEKEPDYIVDDFSEILDILK